MKLKLISPRVLKHPDGYANSTQDLIDEFKRQGVHIVDGFNDKADFTLVYGYPTRASKLPKDEPYGVFTMFESTQPPAEWKSYLKKAKFVAVPTKWGAKTFHRTYGVEPIYSVNLAYSQKDFKYIQRYPKPEYTFLTYNNGMNDTRKGFYELIKAFKLAFKDEPVKLIVKDMRIKRMTSNQEFLLDTMTDGYNIEYINAEYTREELMGLLSLADCFVFPSRGEGWGHTPLEAMATGLPAIVPNEHGISEYFQEPYCIGYKTHKVSAQYDSLTDADYGVQTKADVEDLARVMYETYKNAQRYRDMAVDIAKYARKYEYFWTVKRLMKLINDQRNNSNI